MKQIAIKSYVFIYTIFTATYIDFLVYPKIVWYRFTIGLPYEGFKNDL